MNSSIGTYHMARQVDRRQTSILRSLDWWTILLYVALLSFGWISVCGASYSFEEPDIFSLSTRSGMQIVWIGTSIVLGFVIIMLDDRFYDTFAYIFFILLVLLLFATIFNPHSIKGSRSWLVLGPLRLQPAEFAKFATALALAKFMSAYDYNISQTKHFIATLGIILVPMICIILQRETGSALVYLSFFLMFYREGMPGSILFTGVAMVVYFVVGIRYAEVYFGESTVSIGKFTVMFLIQIFSVGTLFFKQFHFSLFNFFLVGMVFLDVPYVIWNTELFGYIAQILMIADNTRNIDVPFSSFPSCQQVVKTMAHFRHENRHSWTFVAEIQLTCHLVSLGIKRIDVFLDFFTRNQEFLQFPFNSHKKHAVLFVYILVKVYDIALVIRDKSSDF